MSYKIVLVAHDMIHTYVKFKDGYYTRHKVEMRLVPGTTPDEVFKEYKKLKATQRDDVTFNCFEGGDEYVHLRLSVGGFKRLICGLSTSVFMEKVLNIKPDAE